MVFKNLKFPTKIKIVEVGPRDGLQNESVFIPTSIKVDFINLLSDSGLSNIEVTSFINKKVVPQFTDAEDVLESIKRKPGVTYSTLVPNMKGFNIALKNGVREIAVFASASEMFSKKNINCSVQESLDRFKDVIDAAKKNDIRVRGYVSCVIGCPYSGAVSPAEVARVSQTLHEMGCYEISLGDTTGIGTPYSFLKVLESVERHVPINNIAVHCHDTYGQALVNIYACISNGVSVVDASVSGLGGCPYAPGATGNVATEDVVYLCNGLGIETNVDLKKLILAGNYICKNLGRSSNSKVANAMIASQISKPAQM